MTTMATSIPNVKDTCFPHQVLTRIHGTPVYETLKILSREITANAASVPTTLGGGNRGHLGLVVSAKKYNSMANTSPWVTPVNPGPYTPSTTGTGPQIEAGRAKWRAAHDVFSFCQATEKALVAQVVDSVDPIYLRAVYDRTTGQYAENVRDVLTHLFVTYGKVNALQVRAKENAIFSMAYDISTPVDTVFDAIEDLADYAEFAQSPLSPQQMMDLAYMIFSKEPVLQPDLRAWNRLPTAHRTWATMVPHFREAQTDLSSLPTAGPMFHQANTVANMTEAVAQCLLDSMPPAPYVEPPIETINAAITAPAAHDPALLAQLQELTTLLRTSAGNTNSRPRNNRNNRGRGAAGGTGRPTDTKNRPRLYCWSHGACAHGSSECNNPLPGHATTATFLDLQGGSTKNVQYVPPNHGT